jgi:hypothetical protein
VRVGHVEWMVDRDAATIDVVALVIDLHSVAAVRALLYVLRRNRFAVLPEINVVHHHARVLSLPGTGLLNG